MPPEQKKCSGAKTEGGFKMGDLYIIELKETQQCISKAKLAVFKPVLSKERNIIGKPELESEIFVPNFIYFIKRSGFIEEVKGEIYKTEDGYGYLRAMIYAGVMSTLKKHEWGTLEDIVFSMEPISLRFWASKLKNTYWKYKDSSEIKSLARKIWEVENF